MPKPPLDKTHPRLATLLHIFIITAVFTIIGTLATLRGGGNLGWIYFSVFLGILYGSYSALKENSP